MNARAGASRVGKMGTRPAWSVGLGRAMLFDIVSPKSAVVLAYLYMVAVHVWCGMDVAMATIMALWAPLFVGWHIWEMMWQPRYPWYASAVFAAIPLAMSFAFGKEDTTVFYILPILLVAAIVHGERYRYGGTSLLEDGAAVVSELRLDRRLVYLYAPGHFSLPSQVFGFFAPKVGTLRPYLRFAAHIPLLSPDVPLAAIPSSAFPRLDVGGARDGRRYARGVMECLNDRANQGRQVVLVGFSRGAATVASALVYLKHSPEFKARWETEIRPRIAFALLLNGFSSFEEVLAFRYGGWATQWVGRAIRTVYARWLGWQPGYGPADHVKAGTWPTDVPVAFVTAGKDSAVDTAAMVARVIEPLTKVHPQVRHLHLPTAGHELPFTSQANVRTLRTFVDTLYRDYMPLPKK